MKDTESNICQIAVIKDSRLVLSETYHGYSKNACCHIASATKSIVALLVGIAPRENFLAANAVVAVTSFFKPSVMDRIDYIENVVMK